MSEKAYGDHFSRNVVKNPLLSTAVTGLSLDELRHNAVLLPVSQSSLIASQDHKTVRPQQGTLGHTNQNPQTTHSGDANANKFHTHAPQPQIDHTPITSSKSTIDTKASNIASTLSKASAKDDFDVNEYFARLHSTKYTSAPLNNPNLTLDTPEENLEEINLNDSEGQSLTADIAQNFSQLPQVLPQVASAVFSSFSGILNFKREADVKMSESVPHVPNLPDTAPVSKPLPPKEPPLSVGGPNTYRITTKKKAYAQIPGLSSGGGNEIVLGQSQIYNPFPPNEPSLDPPIASVISKNEPEVIIPPPPTFSNLPPKDPREAVSRSVMPPSVARRLPSYNPTPQVIEANIFTPSIDESFDAKTIDNEAKPVHDKPLGHGQDTANEVNNQSLNPSIQNIDAVFNPFHAQDRQAVNTTVPETSIEAAFNPFHDRTHSDLHENQNPPVQFYGPNQNPAPQSIDNNMGYVGSLSTPHNAFGDSNQLTQESAPPLTEPPKLLPTQSYRMTKKRPQYYSGPIEGVGDIGNNIKPVISVDPNVSYKGTVFAPSSDSNAQVFDLSQTKSIQTPSESNMVPVASNDPIYTQFDVSRPRICESNQNDFSTQSNVANLNYSFGGTHTHDTTKEMPRSGLFGSLKSKLGALDINKIQNSVTTFFDPAYNDQSRQTPANPIQYDQSLNLEIFVPTEQNPQSFEYNPNETQTVAGGEIYNESYSYSSYYGNQQDITNQAAHQTQTHDLQSYFGNPVPPFIVEPNSITTSYSLSHPVQLQADDANQQVRQTVSIPKEIDETHEDNVSEVNKPFSFFTPESQLTELDVDSSRMEDKLNTSYDHEETVATEESVSDFNICETCREVIKENKEDKEPEDLTTQLIENITSRIQLLNPVEALLPESNVNPVDSAQFGDNQCANISQITEKTIETLNFQSAIEFFDDKDLENFKKPKSNLNPFGKIGWNLDAKEMPPDHDYSYSVPGALGFYGNNPMFYHNFDIPNNASDEIKAEFVNTLEEPAIENKIPTAPPQHALEDRAIDVQLIEQDAKKDYPNFDEYVIEPSETDDDKIECIEREHLEPDFDSFTSRVEKFKQLDDNNQKDLTVEQSLYESLPVVSPPLTIASYFDTGNYAAETHYKNSVSSSQSGVLFGIDNNYQVYSSEIFPQAENANENTLIVSQDKESDNIESHDADVSSKEILEPNTSENKPEVFNTFAVIFNNPTYDTETHVSTLPIKVPDTIREPEQPNLPLVSDEQFLEPSTQPQLAEKESPPFLNVFQSPPDAFIPSSLLKDIVLTNPQNAETLENQPKPDQALPNPVDFFESNISKPDSNASFNRLASYFATPPKSDNAKPFFELSQGQDHYRHDASNKTESDSKLPNPSVDVPRSKSMFSITQNKIDIPHNFFTNQLIDDLTSSTDFVPGKDEVTKTVNYVNMHYHRNDNFDATKTAKDAVHLNKNDIEASLTDDAKNNLDTKPIKLENCSCLKGDIEEIIDCKICYNHALVGDYKVRKNMDKTDSQKKVTINAEESKPASSLNRNPNASEIAIEEDVPEGVTILSEDSRQSQSYAPVSHHWFHRYDFEGKSLWKGFSLEDSKALEDALNCPDLNDQTTVATDGGRFDVNIMGRLRYAVYWSEKPSNVRRCSWFYKGTTDPRYVPYTEAIAEKLEEEYRYGILTGEWHRRLELPNNEAVVMHGPAVMVHFLQSHTDSWGGGAQSAMRPRIVRRGTDDSEIEDTSPSSVDHLLLMCHGVGSICDLKLRSVEEVVNDFRTISSQLLRTHYKTSCEKNLVGRVEVLPISWHKTLHNGETGVDKRLGQITLESIPRLRNFTNDTVLDVLFYTSPVYCQTIVDAVAFELNKIYEIFMKRNPDFTGGVSLGGHSLGSVILYDILCHQKEKSHKIYVNGATSDTMLNVSYPVLNFEPDALYSLGSPIAIFECIRGVEALGEDFCIPTCKKFFNIFHPYDPIAFRIEPLINPELKEVPPYLIPHHKGRKRMHLELKETVTRMGSDIKQKVFESIKSTWSNIWKTDSPPTQDRLEKVVEEEMTREQLISESKASDVGSEQLSQSKMLGRLNGGRRIDYVLQEAPFELLNEYLSAMLSHTCYWESEDTMLLILREIYDSLGIQPDTSVPQSTLSFDRGNDEETSRLSFDAPSSSK